MAGTELANWNWKVVHRFVSERFGVSLNRSSCLNYLYRLGFGLQAPQEAAAQGGRSQTGGLRGGIRALWDEAGRALAARYSSLTRPISGLTRSCGASGC